LRVMAHSPHLADCSAGIGTLPVTGQVGCRASSGRFPPPLLMRADIAVHLWLYRYYTHYWLTVV
jgi:hypothetical protein